MVARITLLTFVAVAAALFSLILRRAARRARADLALRRRLGAKDHIDVDALLKQDDGEAATSALAKLAERGVYIDAETFALEPQGSR